MRISVDGRGIRNNKVTFSNLSGIVWTRPKTNLREPLTHDVTVFVSSIKNRLKPT